MNPIGHRSSCSCSFFSLVAVKCSPFRTMINYIFINDKSTILAYQFRSGIILTKMCTPAFRAFDSFFYFLFLFFACQLNQVCKTLIIQSTIEKYGSPLYNYSYIDFFVEFNKKGEKILCKKEETIFRISTHSSTNIFSADGLHP